MISMVGQRVLGWISAVAMAGLALQASGAPATSPTSFASHHAISIQGKLIAYTAVAGETILVDLTGKPTASLFSFSYLKDGVAKNAARPVTFVFNGGPGSSSLWLHMGVIGPRRVALDKEVNPRVTPPFTVVDNPDSILDATDLVFIDPVGTGFSHALGDTPAENFYSVDGDAASVAQFIELWLSKNGRWNSPKYVIGESYGSVRAAVLPRALMGGPFYMGVMRGITLNGIVLLGTTLEARDGGADSDSDLAAALALPSMADTAFYHGKVDRAGRSLTAFDAEVTRFATTEYLPALAKASAGLLDKPAADEIEKRLSTYTGLPPSAFGERLRLSAPAFAKRVLADEGLEVGLYDGRYTLPLAHSGGDPVADDPAMGQYVPGFVAAFNEMLHDDLRVEMNRPYGAIVWEGINSRWKWDRVGVPKGQSFAVDLAVAMRRDPQLRVLVASGAYDLVTHAAAAHHALEQAGLPADRTTYKTYESGHMLYLGGTASAFADEIRALIAASR